jgi:DNA polymerase-1
MNDRLDYAGLLYGLDVFSNIDDTKIIAYLATNSTAGNELSLKKLALEYAGNYAILDDDSDIQSIPIDELLEYNLIDVLATWYVMDKYYPILVQDNQLDIYQTIMLPSIRSIVHMQLIGFPIDYQEIKKTNKELTKIQKKYLNQLYNNELVKEFEWILQKEAYAKKHAELKRKIIPLSQFKTKLNPNSGNQVAKLLYEYLELPVINTTDTGLPATDKETLESLLNHVIHKYQLSEEDLK